MSNINVIIDNKQYIGKSGETILKLCQRNDIEIPTLCHDPRLEPYSSCYLCVVEIEGMRTLQTSCSTKIGEGMKITTKNDRVKKARKTALELMASNHYADCAAPCKDTCPAGVDVQGYISLIDKGMYNEAVALIKEVNPLPAICGRVCVRPCEVSCRRNLLDENNAVGIDYLKRFAADYDLQSDNKYKPEIAPSTNKKVAVVGAGPGGLSTAWFLQQKGHQVDIYEASPKGGGMLRYGIPEYRLPNDLLQKEIDNITELGTNIFYNKKLGENVSYKELKENYNSVILTIGSQRGTLIGCEGDDAENVFSGIDFLRNMEMTGKKMDFSGKQVAVVGGGNTAMDCCRSAMRCGAEKVYVIYRRTEKEMPANPIEIHESKLEGIEYLFLTNPSKINKDEEGKLKSMTCLKMQLGEPDKSGRRRPVPIEGSEFELPLDYALAAIGQKTQVDFIENINQNETDGQLVVNRWGDIDADRKTLQTGISSVFAAGDGVTGAATLIEAVAQAKIASLSCHQFLMNEEIKPEEKEFLSKKDNFKEQKQEEYLNKYAQQLREEMPTLAPTNRFNFNEVELGYEGEEIAKNEAQRCLECGCTEYFSCKLKEYSTEYEAEQKNYEGGFNEYQVDFSHPYIEIDNNKCILCSRCVRICKEVVGANALGLINRGFDTYVAPSMGNKLSDTSCENCGLCISACPTGAITENVDFKPGPVKLETYDTICNYCSIGCEITLHHNNGFVMKVTGKEGLINKDTNICKFAKFGYQYLNSDKRITKPLLKENGIFKEISFNEAYDIIQSQIKSVTPDENAFYAGARLTNEEIYLVQKLARGGVKTNNVSSFHYIERGNGYIMNSRNNVPFDEIGRASKIYILGTELNEDNPVVSYMVNQAKENKNIPVELITIYDESSMKNKVDKVMQIESYYYFIKAVNHYLLSNHLENSLFIDGRCEEGFEEYKKHLLSQDYLDLIEYAGVEKIEDLERFARDFYRQHSSVLIFSEKELAANECYELFNLNILTGKIGKTASGIISLKETCNSQGLFDMGSFAEFGIGATDINSQKLQKAMKEKWQTGNLSEKVEENQFQLLKENKLKNIFIFGEDPVGCAISLDKEAIRKIYETINFVVVQDFFLTETAQMANLVLPASFPIETGGSFTNTQKIIQTFDKQKDLTIEKASYQQLLDLCDIFGCNKINNLDEVMLEAISLLSVCEPLPKYYFMKTEDDNFNRRFKDGCDNLKLKIEEEMEEKLSGKCC